MTRDIIRGMEHGSEMLSTVLENSFFEYGVKQSTETSYKSVSAAVSGRIIEWTDPPNKVKNGDCLSLRHNENIWLEVLGYSLNICQAWLVPRRKTISIVKSKD